MEYVNPKPGSTCFRHPDRPATHSIPLSVFSGPFVGACSECNQQAIAECGALHRQQVQQAYEGPPPPVGRLAFDPIRHQWLARTRGASPDGPFEKRADAIAWLKSQGCKEIHLAMQ